MVGRGKEGGGNLGDSMFGRKGGGSKGENVGRGGGGLH